MPSAPSFPPPPPTYPLPTSPSTHPPTTPRPLRAPGLPPSAPRLQQLPRMRVSRPFALLLDEFRVSRPSAPPPSGLAPSPPRPLAPLPPRPLALAPSPSPARPLGPSAPRPLGPRPSAPSCLRLCREPLCQLHGGLATIVQACARMTYKVQSMKNQLHGGLAPLYKPVRVGQDGQSWHFILCTLYSYLRVSGRTARAGTARRGGVVGHIKY